MTLHLGQLAGCQLDELGGPRRQKPVPQVFEKLASKTAHVQAGLGGLRNLGKYPGGIPLGHSRYNVAD